jgi:hypothetical protein
MSNTETHDAISRAIQESRDNAIEAVLSIIDSYKRLQMPLDPKDAYDLGARDAIDTLVIHLTKFAEGLKAGRK